MTNKLLQEFLDLNNLTFDELAESIHMDIREAILKELCDFMRESNENEAFVKKVYRQRSDSIVSTKLLVSQIAHCNLGEEDLVWMDKCIHAYFNKKDKRINLKQVGIGLWNSCKTHCEICGKPVTIDALNVDHVIPWDYVGDELQDNYQILCEHCNKSKGANVSQALEKLIFNKK